MLHPRAIREYLEAPRDSFVWCKSLTNRKLDQALDDIGFRAASSIPLDQHQKVCIALGIAYPHFAFYLDMGCGKTRILLELCNHFWKQSTLRRGIIMCPSELTLGEWEDEIYKWKIDVPYSTIGPSSTAEKWQTVAELGAGLLICTYPSLNWMFANKTKVEKRGVKKMKLKVENKKIDRFAKGLDAFIMDESAHLGNYKSLPFKIANRLSRKCAVRYAAAGVPFGRDPHLLWAQQFLVDRGETLGMTLGLFRGAFFTEKKGYFGGFNYAFREKTEPQLARIVQHRSIVYETAECNDLPPVTLLQRRIKLPDTNRVYFDKFVQNMREAARAKEGRHAMLNIFLRMRQLSSGFIGYKDDETGEKAQIVFDENPKLEALLDTIEAMPVFNKFVIFHEFIFSGHMIIAALKKRGINCGWLWSGEKDVAGVKRRFNNESPKKMRGLLVNHFLGAEGLNLQRANYLHFYESPVGVIARRQAERRTFRKGQTLPGFMYDYIATPIDQRILDFHKTGDNMLRAIIRNPQKVIRGKKAA